MRKPHRSLRLILLAVALAVTMSQALPEAQADPYCWWEGDCRVCCDYCCGFACPWGDYMVC